MNKNRMGKYDDAIPVADFIISKAIGKKPRKPATYEVRMKRGEPKDIEFCKDYDKRISAWNKDYEELRIKTLKEQEKERKQAEEFKIKEIPDMIPDVTEFYSNFKKHYTSANTKSGQSLKIFNPKNPYSETEEPKQYIYTLLFYFLRDDRFFDSPLLRKDLSDPSFDKGTLSIGGYGCGKTSTWNGLLATFKSYLNLVDKINPKNKKELFDLFEINKCISSEMVNKYNTTKDKTMIGELIRPLMSYKPLYIDDILREQDASNFGKINLFLMALTHRADQNSKSHLSLNFLEKQIGVMIENADVEESLLQFRSRYDGRVHDRLFGLYNIIELTGKSFRR